MRNGLFGRVWLGLSFFAWLLTAPAVLTAELASDEPRPASKAASQEPEEVERQELAEVLSDRVEVVGEEFSGRTIPGSAHYLGQEELAVFGDSDLQRILRRVPGVNLQEEDGYGLRPNIGLRGTGVERSSKITLMEDGVLIAPAPYSAPAAYYSPSAGRMEAVEVRKGSAAIKQGPFSNGGAINLISTRIPSARSARVSMFAGSDQTHDGYGRFGQTLGRVGFLVEGLHKQTDGFKRLDGGAQGIEGGDTGFELQDLVGKLRFTSRNDRRFQQLFELKLGDTRQEGDETYLGLTENDFAQRPFRRYVGSSQDRIDTEHQQFQLRHFLQLGATGDLISTVYRNDFFRNWFKNESTNGISNGRILADPGRYPEELAWLRGELDSPDDVFVLRNNRRRYRSEGVQTAFTFGWDGGAAAHRLELGVRVHRDEEDRFQEDDRFGIADGAMQLGRRGLPGSQSNRVASAEALAVFVEDRVQVGRWTLTPGVRLEQIETERLDYGRFDPQRQAVVGQRENSVSAVVPGIGISFQMDDRWQLVAGAHRGFAPPSPSSREQVDPEESVNFEVGVRYGEGRRRFEVIGFVSDYSNLLGADTASGGGTGTGEQWNGGASNLRGIEASASDRWSLASRFDLLATANYTLTRGEFDSSFETGFADWAPRVEAGDRLPYLAEHQLSLEVGLQAQSWDLFLIASYVDEMRTRAGRGAIAPDERIEARTVLDLAAAVNLTERLRLRLKVRNLTDEVYVAARRPYGLRPGLSRTVLAGFEFGF